ncbi:hypothetical protein Pelo_19437 [Pelomyxa schiedti]|nr:hypothetical protein Pelo_19437 [Pelomyxa schiedti]
MWAMYVEVAKGEVCRVLLVPARVPRVRVSDAIGTGLPPSLAFPFAPAVVVPTGGVLRKQYIPILFPTLNAGFCGVQH